MAGSLDAQDIYVFEIQAVNVLGVAGSPATLAVLGSPTLEAIPRTPGRVSSPELPANVVNYVLSGATTTAPLDRAWARGARSRPAV